MKKKNNIIKMGIKFELYPQEIDYILTGLELYSLNLNNIWHLKKDEQLQNIDRANIQLLYNYLLQKNNLYKKGLTKNLINDI